MPYSSELNIHIQTVISHLKDDLKTIRTGRANPMIVETLIVETYGGQTQLKLMELATITTEGPSIIVIAPFDPSTVPDIEKAILKSPLGLTPQVQGQRILIRIPPLSEEQREKYIKLISQKVEDKKNQIRNHRDEIRKKIKLGFETKEITEDDKFRAEKEIDIQTQKAMEEIQIIKDKKEAEIREV